MDLDGLSVGVDDADRRQLRRGDGAVLISIERVERVAAHVLHMPWDGPRDQVDHHR